MKEENKAGARKFPCTSTWAARKLEADQKKWEKVMPCFYVGGVGRPKQSLYTHPKGTQKTAS